MFNQNFPIIFGYVLYYVFSHNAYTSYPHFILLVRFSGQAFNDFSIISFDFALLIDTRYYRTGDLISTLGKAGDVIIISIPPILIGGSPTKYLKALLTSE